MSRLVFEPELLSLKVPSDWNSSPNNPRPLIFVKMLWLTELSDHDIIYMIIYMITYMIIYIYIYIYIKVINCVRFILVWPKLETSVKFLTQNILQYLSLLLFENLCFYNYILTTVLLQQTITNMNLLSW